MVGYSPVGPASNYDGYTLNLNDGGDATARNYSLSAGNFSAPGLGVLGIIRVGNIHLVGGTASNTFAVAPASGTKFNVDASAHADDATATLNVSPAVVSGVRLTGTPPPREPTRSPTTCPARSRG